VNEPIAISRVVVDDEQERLVIEVLRSGQLAQGAMVARLEEAFAAVCDVRHAVAVNSGTAALAAAVEGAGIEPGDEIVTTPFTFAATLNAILRAGATARFVDIEPETFNIDHRQLAAAVTDRTRVVMPVHLFGQPARVDEIAALASARGLTLIEDAAQAHGATVAGRPVGSFGIGCFSMYATKNVWAGEGGIVTTNDDELATRLRLIRNQGTREQYRYEIVGQNYRLTEIQAALAIPQLATLELMNGRRGANAARLTAGLEGVPGLVTPVVATGRTHVFHQYTIRVTPEARIDRDALSMRLRERGIGTGVFYPRVVFDHDCYRGHPNVVATEVPEAFRAAGEVLSLPVHPLLSVSDIDCVVDEVRAALGASSLERMPLSTTVGDG
jgi:perosamine synthetase